MLDEISIRQCLTEKDDIAAAGAVHLVERRGEKLLFFKQRIILEKSPFREDSLDLTVSVQPPCAIACINTCAHVKNSKYWQLYTIVWTHKNAALSGRNG